MLTNKVLLKEDKKKPTLLFKEENIKKKKIDFVSYIFILFFKKLIYVQ